MEKRDVLGRERADCAGQLGAAREELTSLKNVVSGYTMRLESRRKKAEAATDKKMKMTMDLGALKNRIALLTEMKRITRLLKASGRLQESQRGILKNTRRAGM
jgi:chromosome segregation protein